MAFYSTGYFATKIIHNVLGQKIPLTAKLAVLRICFVQLFPNWTACSPITYTNISKDLDVRENTPLRVVFQHFFQSWKCGKTRSLSLKEINRPRNTKYMAMEN